MRLPAHFEARERQVTRDTVTFWRRAAAMAAVAVGLAFLVPAGSGQQTWRRYGDSWVRVYSGSIPSASRLRVRGHGPVTVTGGSGREISYTVTVSVITPSA